MHGKDMGVACMIGIMMLGSGCEVGWRVESIVCYFTVTVVYNAGVRHVTLSTSNLT